MGSAVVSNLLGEIMTNNAAFSIAVFPGDGIGPEVMEPCLGLLNEMTEQIGGFALSFASHEAGAELYQRTGSAMPDETWKAAEEADAILLGAIGHPEIRYPDGREIAPQVDMREQFELFAGVRPVRTYPGMPVPLADPRAQSLDIVLIREQTEGLFAERDKGVIEDNQLARDSMTITRAASERLFGYAFDLGRKRKSAGRPARVTCVDKANILKSFFFFRSVFDEVAAQHTDIDADHCHVDAMALNLVRQPWSFDVIVTENLFGDILSDIGAGLMGGMGMAPSADIGAKHALFQPCHGTAPDIAGQGKANPTAMFLSAAMMLDWLGDRHEVPAMQEAGRKLNDAVEGAFSAGDLRPYEFGGSAGTAAITRRVREKLGDAA